MAEKLEKRTDKEQQDIRELAARFFSERSARINGRNSEEVAKQCFRDAEAFLKVTALHQSGDLEKKTPQSVLADCFCPNLKKNHPYNLVSQEFGDINRVKEINATLVKDPTLTKLADLDWDEPTTNLARSIFPRYAAAAALASN